MNPPAVESLACVAVSAVATTKQATGHRRIMADWTERYRPTTLSEVRGNDKARDAFHEWAETWDDHGEAVVLYGSPGVGKTSAAHALANDMGWETVELNASDQRTADVIERFAGRAANNATLAGSAGGGGASGGDTDSRQLVVLDEADNIHGTYDRGGASAITKLVKESGQPIVLIANEFYEMSRGLRNACQDIEFRDVSSRSIVPVLRDICRREEIEYESDALEAIADTNDGDLRGAIKDLQAAAEGRAAITAEDVVTSGRDRAMDLFPFLDAVLKEESAEEALQSAYRVDETPDDLTKWLANNLLSVYEPSEAAAPTTPLPTLTAGWVACGPPKTTATGGMRPTTPQAGSPQPATAPAAGGHATAARSFGPAPTRRPTRSVSGSPTAAGSASTPPVATCCPSCRR